MSAGKKDFVVGFDLGATKMMAVVYDRDFTVLGRNRCRTKGHQGVKAGLTRIGDTIRNAMKDAGVAGATPVAIGIGAPGPVNAERGLLLAPPNLGWRNVPIRRELEKVFRCPVTPVNDVDAGTFGEYRFGAGRKARCVLGVFPGTGIGGACVYQDRIIEGRGTSCMEIGHICVQPDGPLCGCGRRGCLETVASRLAIAQAAAAAVFRGEAPRLQQLAGTDLNDMRSSVLAEAIEQGDTVIEGIVRTAAGWLGRGIASVVNLLAPDVIVLGGGLVAAMPAIFKAEVEAAARSRVMPIFEKSFKVVVAQLGDDATVKGAAAWVRSAPSKPERS